MAGPECPEPGDIERRVSDLEHRVEPLDGRTRASEQDARAARHLAAESDRGVADLHRDVRELRAEAAAFQAEMRARFATKDDLARFATKDDLEAFRRATAASFTAVRVDHRALADRIDAGFAEMRGRLDGTAAGMEQIAGMLTLLIERDARPEDG